MSIHEGRLEPVGQRWGPDGRSPSYGLERSFRKEIAELAEIRAKRASAGRHEAEDSGHRSGPWDRQLPGEGPWEAPLHWPRAPGTGPSGNTGQLSSSVVLGVHCPREEGLCGAAARLRAPRVTFITGASVGAGSPRISVALLAAGVTASPAKPAQKPRGPVSGLLLADPESEHGAGHEHLDRLHDLAHGEPAVQEGSG